MPNATVGANARVLPETIDRRALMRSIVAAGAVAAAAVPEGAIAAESPDAELDALIERWHESHRVFEEAYEAYCQADDRSECPPPQALVATESGEAAVGRPWKLAIAGRPIRKDDVVYLRCWIPLSYRFGEVPYGVFPPLAFRARAEEIVAAWDQWQAEQEAAKGREGVAEAEARWKSPPIITTR